MVGQWQTWLAGAPAVVIAFMAAQLALLVIAVPLWSWIVDRWRWAGLRRLLLDAALEAHGETAQAAVALSRELFRENQASPLERLTRVRRSIAHQAEVGGQLRGKCAILGHAVDARTAPAILATTQFCDAAASTMREVTALYLREAVVRVGSNVAYGDDQLGFRPGQVVSSRYLEDLQRLSDSFSVAAEANRATFRRLGRRMRRGAHGAKLAAAAEHADTLAIDIQRFGQRLHRADPDSPDYRNRPRGEMAARTLDGLIARFDRGGLVRPREVEG
ncbi:MAG: hypothetical protein B7Y97_08220 [Sphingomonas sp. 32-66-10]|nr:MAG: hypothetical protein B7Y97_08220 [Sphingomonas sp. 32-66-10]